MRCQQRADQHRGVNTVAEHLAEQKSSDHGSAKGGHTEQGGGFGIPAKIAQTDFESCHKHEKHPPHLAEEVANRSYLSSQGETPLPNQHPAKNQSEHARQPESFKLPG